MIFLSAGHQPGVDPGAVYNNRKEADEAVMLRDATAAQLDKLGAKYTTDQPNESLSQYLKRIQTGTSSVVCEIHFNAGGGTGVEVLVQADADKMDKACAKELTDGYSRIMGIKNRGVKSEADSHHGRLALMREQGIVVLIEVCFIDKPSDMAAYDQHIKELAALTAEVLVKYDGMMG